MAKSIFYQQKQLFAGFYLLAAIFLLSACLPDGTSGTKEKSAEQTKIQSGKVASSLSNIAIQMQSRIVSDAAVYAAIKADSWEIDLGTLAFPALGTEKVIYASADDVAQTRAFLCPLDGTETRFQQVTWLDTRNADGTTFSMKGVGENSGPLLRALGALTSSNSVGLFQNGLLNLNNGDEVTLPSSCGATAAIPNNAPVILYTIDRPAPPSQDIARTEYQTTACPAPSIGQQLQSRKFIIRADGTNNSMSPEAVWTNVGDGCATAANINADPMTQTIGQAPEVNIGLLAGDAAASLRTSLLNQLATPCVSSKTTKTLTPSNDADPERPASAASTAIVNSSVETCPTSSSITVAPEPTESNSGTPRTETMTTVCSSAGLSNTGTGSYAGFNGSVVLDSWAGNIILERLVSVSTNEASRQGDTTGAWRGRSLMCARTENLTVTCDRYYNAALNERNSGANSLDALGSNLPYKFSRTANVNGFSNANTLQPNGVTYTPDWTLQSGTCGWTETEVTPAPTNCTYPNEFAEAGTRSRSITVNADGVATTGAWSADTAYCAQGIDYREQFQANVGTCYGPSRNWDCTLNFNLRQVFRNRGLSDTAINRLGNVSLSWKNSDSVVTARSNTTFNFNTPPGARHYTRHVNRGFAKTPNNVGFNSTDDQFVSEDFHGPLSRKGLGTQLTYTYSNNEVSILGYSWGWGSGGTAGNVNGNPLTVRYTTRVKAGTAEAASVCTETSETTNGECPAGMVRKVLNICDRLASATDDDGNTTSYCAEYRCEPDSWAEIPDDNGTLVRTCTRLATQPPVAIKYSRRINADGYCGYNTDWVVDQSTVIQGCEFPPPPPSTE